jgi:hypothetical protein
MRKRLLTFAMMFGLAAGSFGIFATRTTHAQCGCSCAMECGNRCGFECYGCTVSEAAAAGYQCCVEAHKLTGNTPPCGN